MPSENPRTSEVPVQERPDGEIFSEADRAAGMSWIIRDGVLANVYVVLTGGMFLTGFALMLGANEVLIGLIGGLPRLSQLMQPLGSYFVERLQMRKRISVWVFGPARMLWLLVIALPLLVGYSGGRSAPGLAILLSVALASGLLAGFAATSWLRWMADLIPEGVRGSFFGRRTMLAGGTSAAVGFAAGKFIDWWGARFGTDSPTCFLIVFTVATLCGLASWYTLIRCPEPPIPEEPPEKREPFGAMLREAWSDANFRNLVYAIGVLTCGVWLAGPFWSVYMIKHLGLPYSLMGIMAACSSAGSLIMVRFWGAMCDHFGNRPVILTSLIGAAVLPLIWLLSAGGSWWPLVLAHLTGGAAWSGVMLGQMNLVFKITPERHKSVYIGIFYALSAVPSLFSPLLAGFWLERTEWLSWELGSWHIVNFHLLFIASAAVRAATIPLFRRVQEPEARKVTHMIRVLSHVRSLNPAIGLHYALMVSHAASNHTQRAADVVKAAGERLAVGYSAYLRRNGSEDDDAEGTD